MSTHKITSYMSEFWTQSAVSSGQDDSLKDVVPMTAEEFDTMVNPPPTTPCCEDDLDLEAYNRIVWR